MFLLRALDRWVVARCLTLESQGARYNRGARKAQKRITVGPAKARCTEKGGSVQAGSVRRVSRGSNLSYSSARDDGPGWRRDARIQDKTTALSMETRLRWSVGHYVIIVGT